MGGEEVEIRTIQKFKKLYSVKEYKFHILMVTGVLGSKKCFLSSFLIQACLKERIEQTPMYPLSTVVG